MSEELKIIIGAEIDKLKKNIKEGKRLIDNFGEDGEKVLQEFNDEVQKVGDIAKKSMAVMGAAFVGAITALLALTASTAEYRQQQAMLKTAFETAGGTAAQATQTYNELYRVLGDSGEATEAAQQLAQITTEEKALSEYTTILKGVWATWGESISQPALAEAINHTSELGSVQGVLADALEWSGVNVDSFNEQLAACSSVEEREALIRSTLNGLYSEAAANYELNNAAILAQNEANAKMEASMAAIGEALAPVNTALTELGAEILAQLIPYIEQFAADYLPQITAALSDVGTVAGEVISFIVANWDWISTIAAIILGICAALSVFSTVMGIVNAVMMASPVTWIVLAIVAAIAALVAIIVVVIKYWDEIKAATLKCWEAIKNAVSAAIDWVVGFFQKLLNFVKENWQGLLLLIVNPFAGAFKLAYDNCEGFREKVNQFIEKVKSIVKSGFNFVKENIINPIRNAFSSVQTTFSNIVSTIGSKIEQAKNKVKSVIEAIKGFFSFNISWPHIPMPHFGISPQGWKIGDLLKGSIPKLNIDWYAEGGVFESPTLFNYGNGAIGGLGEAGAEAVVPLENNTKWMNILAEKLSERMGGNTPIILTVDGKVFAQTAINTINRNTRQTGKLALNLV